MMIFKSFVLASIFLTTYTLSFASAAVDFHSPCDIQRTADSKLVIVEKDANQLRFVNPSTLATIKTVQMPNKPTGLVQSADFKTFYVTASMPAGVLLKFDSTKDDFLQIVPAGHSPEAPTLSPDGTQLAVCDRFGNKVRFFDPSNLKELGVVETLREPSAIVYSKDGAKIYVTNFLPNGPATDSVTQSKISVIDAKNFKYLKSIKLDNGAIEQFNIRSSPDGKWAFVPHVLARYQVPTSFIERGWIATNAVAIIDLEKEKLYVTVLLDDAEIGATNPSDVTLSPDGKTLCCLTAGSHELITIPFDPLMEKIHERMNAWKYYRAGNRKPKAKPADDLSFILNLRTRRPTGVNGPRRMAFIGDELYTVGYFSDEISKINIYSNQNIPPTISAYGKPLMALPIERRGERYFNDAAFCFQQWLTCATCHPDGRMDGLNWDLVNDGIGNPKNSRSMLYSIYNPPVMATGIRPNAEYAIRTGMTHIQFHKLDENTPHGKEVYTAIENYYKKMKAVQSPALNRDGTMTESAKRGEFIFAKAACTACHYGPYYSDLQMYDVKTTYGQDSGRLLRTPILNELWRTAPYLHDGRSASLKEIITKHNPGKRGNTSSLTEAEIDDLVEYLRSL